MDFNLRILVQLYPHLQLRPSVAADAIRSRSWLVNMEIDDSWEFIGGLSCPLLSCGKLLQEPLKLAASRELLSSYVSISYVLAAFITR